MSNWANRVSPSLCGSLCLNSSSPKFMMVWPSMFHRSRSRRDIGIENCWTVQNNQDLTSSFDHWRGFDEILSISQVLVISLLTWSAARSSRGSIFTSDRVGLRGLCACLDPSLRGSFLTSDLFIALSLVLLCSLTKPVVTPKSNGFRLYFV